MLLRVEGLRAGYGSGIAIDGVSLALAAGEVAALQGRNGTGKTTTIRAIMGYLRPRAGSVAIDGRPVDALPPHARARLGLGLVPEGRQVFATLTVHENLVATARPPATGTASGRTLAAVLELFPRLAERARQPAGSLSGGEQQMLVIGRALLTNPRLLLLDEATEGLAPLVRREIWAALDRLKAEGLAMIVVDRDLAATARLADRHVVLEKGRVVWQGSARGLEAAAARHLAL